MNKKLFLVFGLLAIVLLLSSIVGLIVTKVDDKDSDFDFEKIEKNERFDIKQINKGTFYEKYNNSNN